MKICQRCGEEMPSYKHKWCCRCARDVHDEQHREVLLRQGKSPKARPYLECYAAMILDDVPPSDLSAWHHRTRVNKLLKAFEL
jgi:hypothetical protein